MKTLELASKPKTTGFARLLPLYLVISLLLILAFSDPQKLSILILIFYSISTFLLFKDPAYFTIIFVLLQIIKDHALTYITSDVFHGQSIGNIDALFLSYLLLLVFLSNAGRGERFHLGPKRLAIPMGLVLLLGLISGFRQHVSPFILLHGAYFTMKGFILYLIFLNLHVSDYDAYCRKLIYGVLFLSLVALSGILPNIAFPKEMMNFFGFSEIHSNDVRWFLPSVQSFFCHPKNFCWFLEFGFLLGFTLLLVKKYLWGLLWMAGCFSGIFLSMRRTEIVASLASLSSVMLIRMERISLKKKLLYPFLSILLILPASGILKTQFEDAIKTYITPKNPDSIPRIVLLVTGINLANQNFPLGVGFGRFGSVTAARYYSPVYEETGLSKIRGLRPGDERIGERYLTDTFYPHIIAETGWVGFIFFISFIIFMLSLIKKIVDQIPQDYGYLKAYSISIFCYIIFVIIVSIGVWAFEETVTQILLFGGLGVLVNYQQSRTWNHKLT